MSSFAGLLIILAVIATVWVVHVIRQVTRERRRPSHPDTADAYEGNLVVPLLGSKHPDRSGIHAGGHGGVGGVHH